MFYVSPPSVHHPKITLTPMVAGFVRLHFPHMLYLVFGEVVMVLIFFLNLLDTSSQSISKRGKHNT